MDCSAVHALAQTTAALHAQLVEAQRETVQLTGERDGLALSLQKADEDRRTKRQELEGRRGRHGIILALTGTSARAHTHTHKQMKKVFEFFFLRISLQLCLSGFSLSLSLSFDMQLAILGILVGVRLLPRVSLNDDISGSCNR